MEDAPLALFETPVIVGPPVDVWPKREDPSARKSSPQEILRTERASFSSRVPRNPSIPVTSIADSFIRRIAYEPLRKVYSTVESSATLDQAERVAPTIVRR